MAKNGQSIESLPQSWEQTALEDVCEILDNRRIPVNNSERQKRVVGKRPSELYPYYGATGQVGLIDDYIFEGEHVLLGEDGAPFLDPFKNKAYIASGKFWVNNHAHILRASASNRYLCYYLNFCDYSEFVTGTTRLKLNQAVLKSIPVRYAPKNEQERIVSKIEQLFSELDKGIENLKTAREQLKVYRQAVLKHAFEGKLTEKWREENSEKLESADQLRARIKRERAARYQQQFNEWKAAIKAWEANGKRGKKPSKSRKYQPIEPPDISLPTLPSGWEWEYLGNLDVDVFDGPFGSNLKSSDYVDDGVRVIRLENIGFLEFIEEKYSYVTEEKYETVKKHTVHAGDLIFSSFVADGIRVSILPDHIDRAINKADCFCVRLYGETVNSDYVANFLSTRAAYKQVESEIHGIGRPRINTTQLKDFAIPICSPEEQRQIISIISDKLALADRIGCTIEQELDRSEALRQSILKTAFSGQLVEQDPNDEPASELLSRIKAEKEEHDKAKKAGKKKVKKKSKRKDAA